MKREPGNLGTRERFPGSPHSYDARMEWSLKSPEKGKARFSIWFASDLGEAHDLLTFLKKNTV